MSRSAATSAALSILLFAVLGAAAGVASYALATRQLGPGPELADWSFHLVRPGGDPLEVSDARARSFPYSYGDFDLTADVELPEGGALDLVMRVVEPAMRADGDMPLFHGRYSVLRLSADGSSGPAFRTRESALFDDPSAAGGHPVAAGLPSTVIVEARGRSLRANVAGVWYGPFEATDAHGGVAFVVRGGTALVHSLWIDALPRPMRLLPASWCAILGALFGVAVGRIAGRRVAAAIAGLFAMPGVALLAGAVVVCDLLPSAEPDVTALVVAALAGGPLGCALAAIPRIRTVRRRPLVSAASAVGLGLVAMLGCWEGFVRLERPRLAPLEDPRLDAYFGALSATAPLDALARRMRARTAVHTVDAAGDRVVCLGGGPLFEGPGDRGEWVAPIAAARASRALRRPVDGTVAPTLYAHTRQQVAMFERFYVDAFAPRVVVLAIPPWEGEASERPDAVAFLDRGALPAAPASALLELWYTAALRPIPAVVDPSQLGAAVDRIAALGRAHGFASILVVPPGLTAPLRAAVDAAAAANGLSVLSLSLLEDPAGAIDPLGAELARVLGE